MAPIARILRVSLLTAGSAAGLAHVVLPPRSDHAGTAFVLACVGGIDGAVGGAARDVVAARNHGRGGRARMPNSAAGRIVAAAINAERPEPIRPDMCDFCAVDAAAFAA